VLHSTQLVWPTDGWNEPPSHIEHAVTAEVAENLPAAHSVHTLAPGPVPVFVTDPIAHSVHDVSRLGLAEYVPTAHAMQVVPSVAAPVLVIEPAWHGKQKDWPSDPWYLPASHSAHEATFVPI
jgi:hypothetical protein